MLHSPGPQLDRLAIRQILRLCVFHLHDMAIAYSSLADDCSGKGGKGVNMENNGCLRQRNRHSVSLGGALAKGGLFCMVRYKDGECNCIEGGKLYYEWPTLGAHHCESQDIEGYTSFHFERIDDFHVSLGISTKRFEVEADWYRLVVPLGDVMGTVGTLSSAQGMITMGLRERCMCRSVELSKVSIDANFTSSMIRRLAFDKDVEV